MWQQIKALILTYMCHIVRIICCVAMLTKISDNAYNGPDPRTGGPHGEGRGRGVGCCSSAAVVAHDAYRETYLQEVAAMLVALFNIQSRISISLSTLKCVMRVCQ